MPDRMIMRAPAKINLGLKISCRRDDGYHEIETVMQQVSLADILLLEPAAGRGFSLNCTDPSLDGEHNLIWRAAKLLEERAGKKLPGARLVLYKNIPVEAGLAGGSADAAAALKGLNLFWQLGFKPGTLLELGASLGSDVPFCLEGGTALAGGRGEIITRLPDCPFLWVVLALPPGAKIATAAAYNSINKNFYGLPDLAPLVEAIKKNDRNGLLKWADEKLTNTLETAELPEALSYRVLKKDLTNLGLKPLLSGSGPALFILCGQLGEARRAARAVETAGGKAYLCWTESGNGV